MNLDRRVLIKTVGAISIASLAGCTGGGEDPEETESETPTSEPETESETPTPEPETESETPTPEPETESETPTPEPETESETPTPEPETESETPTPEPSDEDVRVQRANNLFEEADWLLNGFEDMKQEYESLYSSFQSNITSIDQADIGELSQSDIDELHGYFISLYDLLETEFDAHYIGDPDSQYPREFPRQVDFSDEIDDMKRFIQLEDVAKFQEPFDSYVSEINELLIEPNNLKRGGGFVLAGEDHYARIREQINPDPSIYNYGLGIHSLTLYTSTQPGDAGFIIAFKNGEQDFKNGSEYSYEEVTIGSNNYITSFPDDAQVLDIQYRRTGTGGNPNNVEFETKWFHDQAVIQLESDEKAKETIQERVESYEDGEDLIYDGTAQIDGIGTVHKLASVVEGGANVYYFAYQFKNYVITMGMGTELWNEKPIPNTWLTIE